MKRLFVLPFLLIILISCSSKKLDKNTVISDQETVIIAQFKIMNNGKDITKNSKLFFDENIKGLFSYRLDETGKVTMKLPKGNHFLKLLYTPYGSSNLPLGYANISIPDNSKVYYIGTIEITTDGMLQKKSRGIIYDTSTTGLPENKLDIKVLNAGEELKSDYLNKFGNSKTIETALLTVSI